MQASVSSTSGFIWHQHSLQQASFVWLIYDYESKTDERKLENNLIRLYLYNKSKFHIPWLIYCSLFLHVNNK